MPNRHPASKNDFHAAKDRLHAAVVQAARHLDQADADHLYRDMTALLDAITDRLIDADPDD